MSHGPSMKANVDPSAQVAVGKKDDGQEPVQLAYRQCTGNGAVCTPRYGDFRGVLGDGRFGGDTTLSLPGLYLRNGREFNIKSIDPRVLAYMAGDTVRGIRFTAAQIKELYNDLAPGVTPPDIYDAPPNGSGDAERSRVYRGIDTKRFSDARGVLDGLENERIGKLQGARIGETRGRRGADQREANRLGRVEDCVVDELRDSRTVATSAQDARQICEDKIRR